MFTEGDEFAVCLTSFCIGEEWEGVPMKFAKKALKDSSISFP